MNSKEEYKNIESNENFNNTETVIVRSEAMKQSIPSFLKRDVSKADREIFTSNGQLLVRPISPLATSVNNCQEQSLRERVLFGEKGLTSNCPLNSKQGESSLRAVDDCVAIHTPFGKVGCRSRERQGCNSDLASVIMPSYNTAEYIADSINSVLNQTYKNFELIIVDDCSTDNTDQIIASLKDPRIKYIKLSINSGAAVARNIALKESKGRWIAFLDSDDLWEKEKLEHQINFMKKNNYAFSYTKYEEINENSVPIGKIVSGPEKVTRNSMFLYCWLGCLTVMYDSEKIGLLQIKNIKKNNDYAMWLKVIRKADCFLLDEVLAKYRRGRKGSVCTQSYITMIKWHYLLFIKTEKRNQIQSLVLTFLNLIFGSLKKLVYVKSFA